MIERAEKAASFEAVERIALALHVDCYELFVPINRRSELVARRIKDLLSDKQDSKMDVHEFLKAFLLALKKLD